MAKGESASTPAIAGDSDDLSSPPTSIAKKLDSRPLGDAFLNRESAATTYLLSSTLNNKSDPPAAWIQPYISGQFDYYNPVTGEEIDEDSIEFNSPAVAKNIRYQAITAPEVYQKFLEDPKDMSYDELYNKLALVNAAMVQIEDEYQHCSKALAERDLEMLHRRDDAAEAQKLRQETRIHQDDLHREYLGKKFEEQLKLGRKDWVAFLKKKKPHDRVFLEQLKNEKFMEDRQKVREAERLKDLVDLVEPPHEKKKFMIPDLEKKMRLGPTFVDGLIFEDMIMADSYGFPYSKHPTHIGRQPIPLKTSINGRTRPRNTATISREDAASNLPSKRVRKARIFADGSDTSRSATPVSSMPVSGNATAKLKAPSKLQDVVFPESDEALALPGPAERRPRKSQFKKRTLDSFQSNNLLPSTEVDDPFEDGTTIAVQKPMVKPGKRRKISPEEEELDPAEEIRAKEAEKERKREQKRAKQSAHMTKRWANGDMEKAKETRKLTLAKKKEEKQLAATHGGPPNTALMARAAPMPILPPIRPAAQIKSHLTHNTDPLDSSHVMGPRKVVKVATAKIPATKIALKLRDATEEEKAVQPKQVRIKDASRCAAMATSSLHSDDDDDDDGIVPTRKIKAAPKALPSFHDNYEDILGDDDKVKPKIAKSRQKVAQKYSLKFEAVDDDEPPLPRVSRTRGKAAPATSAESGEVRHSSRPRKPTTPFGGGDGAIDFDDEIAMDENSGDDSGDADVEVSEADESDD